MFSAAKFVSKNKKKILKLVRFLVVFNVLAIPMYAILLSGAQLQPLQSFTTDIVYAVFGFLGYATERHGTTIALGAPLHTDIAIDADCTAWKSMYAYAALVMATPLAIGWKKRSKLIAAGVLALFALNVVRIVSTVAAAAAFGVATLDVVHTVLWREGMIAAVVLFWFLAVRGYAARPKSKK
ncbi:MAG: exosortase/archaeosortase family protein [Candidatus Aenigmatarchaeota archaeon]